MRKIPHRMMQRTFGIIGIALAIFGLSGCVTPGFNSSKTAFPEEFFFSQTQIPSGETLTFIICLLYTSPSPRDQ